MPSTRQVPVRRRERTEPYDDAPAPAATGGGEELIDGTDELLDEIDSLLEEQSVLTNYRQRSGQ
jgi:Pup-like protein